MAVVTARLVVLLVVLLDLVSRNMIISTLRVYTRRRVERFEHSVGTQNVGQAGRVRGRDTALNSSSQLSAA